MGLVKLQRAEQALLSPVPNDASTILGPGSTGARSKAMAKTSEAVDVLRGTVTIRLRGKNFEKLARYLMDFHNRKES